MLYNIGDLILVKVEEEKVVILLVVISIKWMGYSKDKIKVVINIIKSRLLRGKIVFINNKKLIKKKMLINNLINFNLWFVIYKFIVYLLSYNII